MKITLTFNNEQLTEKYETLGDVSTFNDLNVLEDFPKTEVLILRAFYPIDKKILNWMPNLKVIGFAGTDLKHIDLEECEERGIKVISLKEDVDEIVFNKVKNYLNYANKKIQ